MYQPTRDRINVVDQEQIDKAIDETVEEYCVWNEELQEYACEFEELRSYDETFSDTSDSLPQLQHKFREWLQMQDMALIHYVVQGRWPEETHNIQAVDGFLDYAQEQLEEHARTLGTPDDIMGFLDEAAYLQDLVLGGDLVLVELSTPCHSKYVIPTV